MALELGFRVLGFAAEWRTHGKAAGPVRNERMIMETRPSRVLAFTEAIMRDDRPTGTSDCVMRALAHGISVTIVPPRKLEASSLLRDESPLP